MTDDYPKYLYKYRSIENFENIEKNYSIDNLLENKAIFSSRKNFNDLFDSKIKLIKPTPKQVKNKFKNAVEKVEKRFIRTLICDGKFSDKGRKYFEDMVLGFNEIIDRYAFFSLSSIATSNLMWAHYANSHKGFCIEFKSDPIRAKKVTYQERIPEFKLIKIPFSKNWPKEVEETIGNYIWNLLKTKLVEWEYESEYRFFFGEKIPEGEKFIINTYEYENVESIIFGVRMPANAKEFIMSKMPTGTKFKQAVVQESSIEIVDFNPALHLKQQIEPA